MLVKRELHKELLKDLRVTTSILQPAGVAKEKTRRLGDAMAA